MNALLLAPLAVTAPVFSVAIEITESKSGVDSVELLWRRDRPSCRSSSRLSQYIALPAVKGCSLTATLQSLIRISPTTSSRTARCSPTARRRCCSSDRWVPSNFFYVRGSCSENSCCDKDLANFHRLCCSEEAASLLFGRWARKLSIDCVVNYS